MAGERCPKCEDLKKRRICGMCAGCWGKAQERTRAMDNRNTLDRDECPRCRGGGCEYCSQKGWFYRPAPEASPPAPGKHCASCYCGRRAPVQRDWNKTPEAKPAGHISWEEHLEVYAKYAAQYGTSQSAERMAERGGFGYGEIIMLMGVAPKTWLPGEAPKTPPPAPAPAPGRGEDLALMDRMIPPLNYPPWAELNAAWKRLRALLTVPKKTGSEGTGPEAPETAEREAQIQEAKTERGMPHFLIN